MSVFFKITMLVCWVSLSVSCAFGLHHRLTMDDVAETMRLEGVEYLSHVDLRYLKNQGEWLAEVVSAPVLLTADVCLTKKYQLGFILKHKRWVNSWIAKDDFIVVGSDCLSEFEQLISIKSKLAYEDLVRPIDLLVCHLDLGDGCKGDIHFSSQELKEYFFGGRYKYKITSISREGDFYNMIVELKEMFDCGNKLIFVKVEINKMVSGLEVSIYHVDDIIP